MPSFENNDISNSERDDFLARLAARPSLNKESVVRDTRDDYRQALAVRMRPGAGALADKEWDLLGRLWDITKGGISDEEFIVLEKWWDDELAKIYRE